MNYRKAFDKFTQALSADFAPDQLGQEPESAPRQIDVPSETLSVAESLRTGSIAGYPSANLLDTKEHFPVITQTQAQSSMSRAMQLVEPPAWYLGTVAQLRHEVYAGITKMHPTLELNIRVPAEQVIALSDGETPSTVTQKSVKDPEDDRKADMVPQVARPTLTSAQVEVALENEENRKAVAGRLMEMLDSQIKNMQDAKKVGVRLLKSGIKSDEFDQLSTYVQEDILRELMSRGVTAHVQSSEARRLELLERMTKKND